MADPIELCRYQYDPLDRLAALTPLAQAMARRFYKGESLATELQGTAQSSILRAGDQLLAYKNQSAVALLGTDQQNSVLHAEDIAIAYAPYGHREKIDILPGLPGFNGEQPDPVTGHYLLGNGYRAYNPVLMRFNSPDSLSPFGKGGFNPYAYCAGDPVNRIDPSGHEIKTYQLLSYFWIGLGLFGAIWGAKIAKPALKAIDLGIATSSQQLTARSAVSQVVASSVFTASRVVYAVSPDSAEANLLLALAVAIGLPIVPARIRLSQLGKTGSNVVRQSDFQPIRNTSTNDIAHRVPSRRRIIEIRQEVEITRL
jgi:RHS repeat-associated protein